MTRLAVSLTVLAFVLPTRHASADDQTIYRWQDARGGLHFSNQLAHAPAKAGAVELAPLGSISGPSIRHVRASRGTRRTASPHRGAAPCGPADTRGLADAIATDVDARHVRPALSYLVGGRPIDASPDARVETLVTPWDPDAPQAHLSESAIAYPAGSSCPATPPLVRYPTASERRGPSHGLCDDYQRAFAQVGVAASRDTGVGRSFREVARAFVQVQHETDGATASGFRAARPAMFTSDAEALAPFMRVPLDPWIVAAHVAQTDDLADGANTLVNELTVALEEIDRAARASGCW